MKHLNKEIVKIGENNGFVVEKIIKYSFTIFEKCSACEKCNAYYNKIPKCHLCVREWRKEFGG